MPNRRSDRATQLRAGLAPRHARDRAAVWRFERAVARVRIVDDVVAGYATSYVGRPYRRREVRPLDSAVELPGVTWSIDGEVIVEFFPAEAGPGRMVVHEIALLSPLRKQLRSRHVTIEHRAWRAVTVARRGMNPATRSKRWRCPG